MTTDGHSKKIVPEGSGTALLKRLPAVRGRLTPDAPLGHLTWFGVGGAAQVLFKPEDRDDLVQFIQDCPADIPVTVIGVASNLIIRDGGIPGVVIRLGREFAEIKPDGDNIIYAGAASLDLNVALTAAKHGIAGLEFLSGIPGTIGGALRMNAGAYLGEIKNALITADVLFRDGSIRQMTADDMQMSYRRNALPADVIFLGCRLQGMTGNAAEIQARMDDIKTKRAETQPIKSKTGGSTFANPDGNSAWKVIDAAGMRGFKIGGAEMSMLHCNFMINTGDATAADLERLGEEVRKRVAENSGVMLRWEIKRIGLPLPGDDDILAFMKNAEEH
jgi:UDP-N-acetylmuramate dehydrogenase